MDLQTILSWIGGLTLSVGTAVVIIQFVAKQLFENYLNKRIETHKSDLERLNITHQIQFASLHKERAEAIRKIHDALYSYQLAIIVFFNRDLDKRYPFANLESNVKEWSDAVINFSTLYHKNRIFFTTTVADLLNTINNEMDVINRESQNWLRAFKSPAEQITAISEKSEMFLSLKFKADELLLKVVPLTLQLENEFRLILGVEIRK